MSAVYVLYRAAPAEDSKDPGKDGKGGLATKLLLLHVVVPCEITLLVYIRKAHHMETLQNHIIGQGPNASHENMEPRPTGPFGFEGSRKRRHERMGPQLFERQKQRKRGCR